MENLRMAWRWLQKHWLGGLIVTYLLVLGMTYLAIWQIGEPVGIPDNLDKLPDWMRRRIVFHLILTLLISSHITLILEVLFRKKIWPVVIRERTPNASQDQKLRCEDYGIKILFPEAGQIVEQQFEVIGTFEKKPHPESVKLFVTDKDNQYWPQLENIRFDEQQGRWRGRVNIGHGQGLPRTVMVAIVGQSGQTLCRYFEEVGRRSGYWWGIITLTPDTNKCDSVVVVQSTNV